jgi:hypothetical protein
VSGSPFTGGGLNGSEGIAIDGTGNVWVANTSNDSVTELTSAGVAVSGSLGFTGGGLSGPRGIAIDGSGDAWVANTSSGGFSEFIGAATPVITPLVANLMPAIFGGVGTAGATSSVTASGTTAVLSTSDVLPQVQLGAEKVGETFGPYTPSGQAIYLLLMGGSHTFIDAGTGFPSVFNSPITVTFVNEHGVTLTMYLYQSTNSLYGTYTPKVAS